MRQFLLHLLTECYSSTFCHKGGVICISEVVDISPSSLDSGLNQGSPESLALAGGFLTTVPPGEPLYSSLLNSCLSFLILYSVYFLELFLIIHSFTLTEFLNSLITQTYTEHLLWILPL